MSQAVNQPYPSLYATVQHHQLDPLGWNLTNWKTNFYTKRIKKSYQLPAWVYSCLLYMLYWSTHNVHHTVHGTKATFHDFQTADWPSPYNATSSKQQ